MSIWISHPCIINISQSCIRFKEIYCKRLARAAACFVQQSAQSSTYKNNYEWYSIIWISLLLRLVQLTPGNSFTQFMRWHDICFDNNCSGLSFSKELGLGLLLWYSFRVSVMWGLGLGWGFCLWVDFMFGLVCKYFMASIVARANVMEPFNHVLVIQWEKDSWI